MAITSLGDEHEAFTQWAISKGVQIKGIAPAHFPGRRLGMIANRTIKENDVMLSIPRTAMLTRDSIPSSFVEQFPKDTPNHGILAAFLTHADKDTLQDIDPWRKVWPSFRDFQDTIPLLWPDRLRTSSSTSWSGPSLLPPSISGRWNTFRKTPAGADYESTYQNLLPQQEKRFRNSWECVVSAFPGTDPDAFAYYYHIVNSRSFYYVSSLGEEPEDWNDAVGMVPFADYFNHVDDAPCDVRFDGEKYTFRATRQHEKGEEVYMSYGPHSNDFLLVEYGFCLDDNESDSIYLDDIIFRELTLSQKTELASQELFGNYEITSAGPTSIVQAVACLKYMRKDPWRKHLRDKTGSNPPTTARIINGWIEAYLKECTTTIGIIETMLDQSKLPSPGFTPEFGSEQWEQERLAMLLSRWRQIERLCENARAALLGTARP
ncbi:ribosomal N-lysine methyltransferase [Aspergillus campestris IBT 28561]|uniref:Ribosomal N-lysine methyltransferase n=1 Tax=Aspergillus campestris (strain IBT 28561) TaxID=1392248 RepID=A0A2I1D6Q5_ASPC2|nr:ribosomal N-lysine methyltransferase [Aspergillus campestris IBT 28561]PKY05564.1 ribosomal N-lysine methyltransferase [Aspergillus campestris IBT 28561]